MTGLSLAAADEVYSCSATLRIERHTVYDEAFERFCVALDAFRRSLGEASADELWRPWLYRLYAYRSAAFAAPLPFSHPAACDAASLVMLHEQCRSLELIYGAFAAKARDLLAALDEVCKSAANPLLDAVRSLQVAGRAVGGSGTALLIHDPRLLAVSDAELAGVQGLAGMQVVTPASLRRGVSFHTVIAAGPSHCFPAHVVTAPRAREIHFVHYRWVRDRGHPSTVFPGGAIATQQAQPPPAHNAGADGDEGDTEDFLPQLSWRDISESALHGQGPAAPHEEIDARLVLLEGQAAVFLEADASALVIDLDVEGEARVNRFPISAITPGMLVLLRTEGGGDYIVPVADRILGTLAPAARDRQQWWKTQLRSAVVSAGLFATCLRLIELGSERACEANVRSWISDRSIRTERYADFLAIMRLIGVDDGEAAEFWKYMGLIRRAHNRAGFHIRRLLLEQVRDCDLRELERRGRMDFALQDAGGGALTAYRVQGVSPEASVVPASRIGHPFTLEGSAWHG